jgi:acetyl-CoA C-acetyltransferase
MALGVEKLKDTGYGGLPEFSHYSTIGTKNRIIGANQTAPGMFAMLATRYFNRYGISPDEGKRMLAAVSAKSHHNGSLNPKAHLRREATIEQIVNAPIVAWPLGLFDCCGVSDGSAAAIVCRADMAKQFRSDPIYIKALQIAATSGEEQTYTDYDYTHVETTTRAAVRAYSEAGVKNPREEISMAEVHDCFSITEAVTMEDLQFFGQPIGASGIRMIYEMYKQLQGKADKRQLKNPKYGLTHNLGGIPYRSVASVIIVGL